MSLLGLSFIAGILTVLAPCILPLLPVIIGGSIGHTKRNPLVITASLAVAVVVFTLLLKFSTALIDIPQQVWSVLSGTIIIFFGLVSIFPEWWERLSIRFNFGGKSNELLTEAAEKKQWWGDILLGAALGPVFSSCSPTYFVILATVLPQSLAAGIVHLIAYALGLSLILLVISYAGQRFVKRIQWAADPRGWFKRGLGVLFVLVGIFIMTGADKQLQVYILDKGFFDVTKIEQKLLERAE